MSTPRPRASLLVSVVVLTLALAWALGTGSALASTTVTRLSGWIVISTESLRPARASSTALSTIS